MERVMHSEDALGKQKQHWMTQQTLTRMKVPTAALRFAVTVLI